MFDVRKMILCSNIKYRALIRIVSPTIGMLHDCSENNEEMFIFLYVIYVFVFFGLFVVVGISVKDCVCGAIILLVECFFFFFDFNGG